MASRYPGVSRRCTSTCTKNCTRHTWGYLAEVPGPDGRVQVKRSGYASAKEAHEARQEVLRSHRRGELPTSASSRQTVAEYVQAWLDAKDGIRPSTRASYTQHLRDHITPSDFGQTPLRKVTGALTQEFLAGLATKGLSGATQRRVLATVRSAIADGIPTVLAADPTRMEGKREKAVNRSAKASKIDPWTMAQVDEFADTITDPMLAAMVRLTSRTGLRIGEVCGLRTTDVEADHLVVRQQARRVGRQTIITSPKSDAGEGRRVALGPVALQALRDAQQARAALQEALGEDWTDSGLVFVDRWGQGLVPTTVSKRFGDLVRASGLPVRRFHDLRHTAATEALRAGMPVPVVARWLGHADAAITLRTYSHLLPEDAAPWVARFG